MYLMIENGGVAPIEGFTLLGVSTAREDSSKIGQFGTGCKQGINVLLRHGLNPTIYLGTKRLSFYSEPATMGDKEYHRVFYKLSNRKPEATGFSLEFGEIDWTEINMALREFVSNAIDQSDNINQVTVKIVSKLVAKKDSTRIFIPIAKEVQTFFNDLNKWFLHWVGRKDTTILSKSTQSPARIYRKGVFVRELPSYVKPSLFDYNFGDELTIDECRNLSDWTARYAAARAFAKDQDAIEKLLKTMRDGEKPWESEFGEYELTTDTDPQVWNNAWESTFGDAVVSDSPIVSEMVRRKGFSVVEVPSLCAALVKNGVRAAKDHIRSIESTGNRVIEATPNALKTLDTVWSTLVDLGLTHGKDKPVIHCFSKTMDAESVLCGYYENGEVYLNVDNDNCVQTTLEEVAHHITGSTDCSRDFQQFAFQVATRLMRSCSLA